MSGSLTIIIERDEFGYYGYCPELQGCHSQGASYKETQENLKEAISLYLETMSLKEKRALFEKEIITSIHEVELV